jgi:FtsP/CotA-like multicopper oxidase with cupredoxin domain
MRSARLFAAALVMAAPLAPSRSDLPRVIPNDNRIAAGRFDADTLELDLEVRMATWYPEADSGPGVDVAVFAEAGKPPTIPAPLIRVPAGTTIRVRVTNLLADSTLTVHGLLTRPAGASDSLVLSPGRAGSRTFLSGTPGTYLYFADAGDMGEAEAQQLGGAFIVDEPGDVTPDRVFVINIWGRPIDSTSYANALAINGRSWPWTERLHAQIGDTLRWRVVNVSVRPHPMHLHGFYFRLDALGGVLADSLIAPEERRLLVTQRMRPFTTMQLAWSPDRPGNWLFHCHIGFHVLPGARLVPVPQGHADWGSHEAERHMSGLILGIEVGAPPTYADIDRGEPEHLRLFIQEGAPRGRAARSLGFVLQRDSAEPRIDSVEVPGTPLYLTRGRPTDITVINRTREASVIHWHGIELESYSDGVAGWSGIGDRLAPSVAPGDSFTARLTLPRAGTFMYHTHLNDIEQLTSGLYGGIVVSEPGARDPKRDHLFIVGWDGEGGDSTGPNRLVNGDPHPAPLELAAGLTQRLRFVNIGPADGATFRLLRDTSLVQWRVVAKDGAELAPHQVRVTPARFFIDVGETFDSEVELPPGEYRLVVGNPRWPFHNQRVMVR